MRSGPPGHRLMDRQQARRVPGREEDTVARSCRLMEGRPQPVEPLDALLRGDRVDALDETSIATDAHALDHEVEDGLLRPLARERDPEVELPLLAQEPADVLEVVLARCRDATGDSGR